jgi:hypothetical protein
MTKCEEDRRKLDSTVGTTGELWSMRAIMMQLANPASERIFISPRSWRQP